MLSITTHPVTAFSSSSSALIIFVSSALLSRFPLSAAEKAIPTTSVNGTSLPLFTNSESGTLIFCHSSFVFIVTA